MLGKGYKINTGMPKTTDSGGSEQLPKPRRTLKDTDFFTSLYFFERHKRMPDTLPRGMLQKQNELINVYPDGSQLQFSILALRQSILTHERILVALVLYPAKL